MASRPRPVTATVTKPQWMKMPSPHAMAYAKRHSLDSTGSTASLISVLDHDSYVSTASEDEEEKRLQEKKRLKEIDAFRNLKIQESVDTSNDSYKEFANTKPRNKENNLSAWEVWLITKTKEEREKKKQESRKKKQAKMEKQKEEEDKQAKLEKAEERRVEWMQQKEYEHKLKKKMERQKKRNERILKEEEERRVQEKSERKFNEWLQKKREEERDRKKAEKMKKRQEREEEEKRREVAEQNFQQWYKKAQKRPRSVPNSFGYLSGKLTGYHDLNAYPVPSFYNPIPWQHPQVPKPKPDRVKRTKKKYVWNPDKYY